MVGPDPHARPVVVMTYGSRAEVYGGDPMGTALAAALDAQYGTDLNGTHAPASRRAGMRGSPNNSFRGDLGPLQILDPVAMGKATRGLRAGMGASSALPNSKGPITPPVAVQSLLGPGPL